MTNPTVGASTTGTATTGDVTLTSWTPSDGELLLLFVDCRAPGLSPSVAGNGQTWNLITSNENAQGQHEQHAFYAVASSPSSGSIVVTLSGNTKPANAVAVRITGQHASPIGSFEKAQGPPVTDDNDMKDSLTTTAVDSLIVAWGSYRNRLMNALGSGETSIVDDLVAGSGGDTTTSSLWYEPATSVGTYELGADDCLLGTTDWAVILVEVLAAAGGGGGVVPQIVTNDRRRRVA